MKYYAMGRRKCSVARVYILYNININENKIIINNKIIYDYFQNDYSYIDSIKKIMSNLEKTSEINIKVSGGGITGQKNAIILALARALCKIDNSFHYIFKKQGLLTQDSRIKERKKYGLKKARKASQYSKR
uniref:Small ribosomal subunit protein uS9c n=1 Tax=Boodleopsis sp. H.0758 TaxID=2320802 RepID=A0A386AZS9_9CHLO|nr:ribosomal protein S9 [Boodleopsis sp. H.0758]AYC64941.1 ribosomal protein S9 [Boodleopsis sp. H.0758]